jgi:hypothetical protein
MKRFEWPLAIAALIFMGFLSISEYQRLKHQAANAGLAQQLEEHEREIERLTACAVRQINSLTKICEDNEIRLAQNVETSEWCEQPKPLTEEEFAEFREAWMLRLETGISPMSGRPISLDDPMNATTVALIAGLKVGRHMYQTLTPELQQP